MMAEVLPRSRYAAAGGVVADRSGKKVLVLLRRQRAGPDGRPETRLPKGHIEAAESSQKAALREVREEAGMPALEIVADLGRQVVEYDWQGTHFVRDEHYYLMVPRPGVQPQLPEPQFARLWLSWEEALEQLTFEDEREWVRRAHTAWKESSLEYIAEQHTQQADNNA